MITIVYSGTALKFFRNISGISKFCIEILSPT